MKAWSYSDSGNVCQIEGTRVGGLLLLPDGTRTARWYPTQGEALRACRATLKLRLEEAYRNLQSFERRYAIDLFIAETLG